MSAVSIAGAWPPAGHPFTAEELDRMPDDGHRYEVVDGTLVVSSRPGLAHQIVATRLVTLLSNLCPNGLHAVVEPAVQISADTEFVPDVAVLRQDQLGGIERRGSGAYHAVPLRGAV